MLVYFIGFSQLLAIFIVFPFLKFLQTCELSTVSCNVIGAIAILKVHKFYMK